MEHENDILIKEDETDTMTATPYSEMLASEQNDTIKKEYQKFTDYSTEKHPKEYEEYEIVQTYTPRKKKHKNKSFNDFINEQNSYIPANETYIYEKAKPQKKLKPINKIFVCICCTIAILMGTLGIINSVNINNLSSNITSTTQEITNIGKEIVDIDRVIEGINDETNIKNDANNNGLTDITTETEIELNKKNVVEDYEGTTNFFDKICNFFMRLFGG